MVMTAEAIAQLLAEKVDQVHSWNYQLFIGVDFGTATQVLNFDGSSPKIQLVRVDEKIIRVDPNIQSNSEVYRLRYLPSPSENLEQFLNQSFWIKHTTQSPQRVTAINKDSHGMGHGYWSIYFVRGQA